METEYEWHTHKRYTRWLGATKGEESGLVSYWQRWLAVNDVIQRRRPSWEWWEAHREGTQR